jgi:hypothetical protein
LIIKILISTNNDYIGLLDMATTWHPTAIHGGTAEQQHAKPCKVSQQQHCKRTAQLPFVFKPILPYCDLIQALIVLL